MKKWHISGTDGRDVFVSGSDWMGAMTKAIQILDIQASSWMVMSGPGESVQVFDPSDDVGWRIDRAADDVVCREPTGPIPRVRDTHRRRRAREEQRSAQPLPPPVPEVRPSIPAEPPHAPPEPPATATPPQQPASTAPEDVEEFLARYGEDLFDIALSTDIAEACEQALELVGRMVPCGASSVLTGGSRDDRLTFTAATGPAAEQIRGASIHFGQGLAGFCYDVGASLRFDDVANDQRHLTQFDRSSGFVTSNAICVPVRYNGEYYGVLQLLNAPAGFEPWHVTAAERVAHHLGQALAGFLG